MDAVHYLQADEHLLICMLDEHMLFVSVGIKMILRYDSNAFYSIGTIFLVTLIFYLLIDLENNHVERYLPPTEVATNPRDTLESNGRKLEMETPSRRKKFSSLKELKDAAKVALDTCLCSSKQRSSWFGQQVGKVNILNTTIPT